MEGTVFAVVALPRSGTKWYSSLFTNADAFCYHELMTQVSGWPALAVEIDAYLRETASLDEEQRLRRFFLDAYPTYYSRLFELLERGYTAAGNSDNVLVERASGAWLVWPSTRFVFSTRDGINQVNSQFDYFLDVPAVSHATRRNGEFEKLSPFEQVCSRWATATEAWLRERDWLEAHGAACTSTTLERVTADAGELERIFGWIGLDWERHRERALSLMRQPVNSRINLDGAIHDARAIWTTWSSEQRATFADVCGALQVKLGYELPGSL